jgi:hypothetical protein
VGPILIKLNEHVNEIVDVDDLDGETRTIEVTKLKLNKHVNEIKFTDKSDDIVESIPPALELFQIPDTWPTKVVWLILLPINILYFFTVPDCRRPIFRKFPYYYITFVVSTIYVGIFTYALVWFVILIGIY